MCLQKWFEHLFVCAPSSFVNAHLPQPTVHQLLLLIRSEQVATVTVKSTQGTNKFQEAVAFVVAVDARRFKPSRSRTRAGSSNTKTTNPSVRSPCRIIVMDKRVGLSDLSVRIRARGSNSRYWQLLLESL